jgi:hypothetical protein
MGSELHCILNACVMAVVLNLGLSYALAPMATPEEVKPPGCPSKLPLKSQVMHMLVHHKQVPLVSSVIVALVTGLAVYLGYKLKPIDKLM